MVKPTYSKLKHIHMIGIGGTGMNGIAEVLINLGYKVSGSDSGTNEATARLTKLGAKVAQGHQPENVHGADVVVTSTAIREDNLEVREARRLKIPVIPRAEMLAELMRMKMGIAVAGSHGKTTTTSMIATVLDQAGFDPTIVVGGRLNTLGANARLGAGDFFVAEADESDRSFLMLSPFIAVLTNIDAEHLDQYKGVEDIKKDVHQLRQQGALLLADHPLPGRSPPAKHHPAARPADDHLRLHGPVGHLAPATWRFSGLHQPLHPAPQGRRSAPSSSTCPGKHMISNAMAAVAVGLDLDIPPAQILESLDTYAGTGRRFELKGDDQRHHGRRGLRPSSDRDPGDPRRRPSAAGPAASSPSSSPTATPASPPDGRLRPLLQPGRRPRPDRDLPGGRGAHPRGHRRGLYEEIRRFGHKDAHFEPDMAKIPAQVESSSAPATSSSSSAPATSTGSSPICSTGWRGRHESSFRSGPPGRALPPSGRPSRGREADAEASGAADPASRPVRRRRSRLPRPDRRLASRPVREEPRDPGRPGPLGRSGRPGRRRADGPREDLGPHPPSRRGRGPEELRGRSPDPGSAGPQGPPGLRSTSRSTPASRSRSWRRTRPSSSTPRASRSGRRTRPRKRSCPGSRTRTCSPGTPETRSGSAGPASASSRTATGPTSRPST